MGIIHSRAAKKRDKAEAKLLNQQPAANGRTGPTRLAQSAGRPRPS